MASLPNSRPSAECNRKLLVEHSDYESVGQLYVDDEYCPANIPMNQRVTPLNPTPPSTPAQPLLYTPLSCRGRPLACSRQQR